MSEQSQKKRYPKNVPGPFYVANGECLICGAPERFAPDLIGYDEENLHCYFKKQPTTTDELDQAAKAVAVACCEAIHYEGDDPAIKQRIFEVHLTMIESAERKS
jgi:hypothetical protein